VNTVANSSRVAQPVPSPPPPTMSLLEAKVKSVLSGDTVILHNINNPKQERTLSLAYVTAPRMRREGDEVCSIFHGLSSAHLSCMQRSFVCQRPTS
jgi:hypothetical protein